MPLTRGSVVLVGETDVAHPGEDALEADPTFGACQRTAGARVHAAAEGDVVESVLAVDREVVGTLEPTWVAVGGAVQEHHRRAGLDLHARDGGRAKSETEVGLHRALDAQ